MPEHLTEQDKHRICSSEYGFRVNLLERMVRLETKLEGLLGNGQPGTIAWIKKKINEHDRALYLALGAVGVVVWIIELLH